MSTESKEPIILFYDGFEKKAIDSPFGHLYSSSRGMARYIYRTIRGVQPYTGFYTAFNNAVKSFESEGHRVFVNNFNISRKNPEYPIGLCGYKSVFQATSGLPNPAFAFHSDFGKPDEVSQVTQGNNMKAFALGVGWSCDLYRSTIGDKIHSFFVGIDTEKWPDLSHHQKDIDFLIYDKIRWRRKRLVPELLERVQAKVSAGGHSSMTLRYGAHHLAQFRTSLKRAKAMIFLCEHETQGLAYQEALASGVPILAWDEGELVDPNQKPYLPETSVVTSVPYFSEDCGVRFKMEDFDSKFAEFTARMPEFQPRRYVQENLSFKKSVEEFLKVYREIGDTRNFNE